MIKFHRKRETQQMARSRRLAYRFWIGAMVVAGLAVMAAPAVLALFDVRVWTIAVPIPFLMIGLSLFGVAWLAYYVFVRRPKSMREQHTSQEQDGLQTEGK